MKKWSGMPSGQHGRVVILTGCTVYNAFYEQDSFNPFRPYDAIWHPNLIIEIQFSSSHVGTERVKGKDSTLRVSRTQFKLQDSKRTLLKN